MSLSRPESVVKCFGLTGLETPSWVSFALLRDQPFDKEPEMARIRQVATSVYITV